MIEFTSSDLYRFDLQGFIQIPNAIDPTLLANLNEYVDALLDRNSDPTIRIDNLLDKRFEFEGLLDAIDLSPLFGGGAYRLDHDFLQVIRQGKISKALHGGATPFDPAQSYLVRDGKIFCGLISLSIALNTQLAEWGGLGIIPGTHRSNFPPPDDESELVQCVGVKAGDAIIFTEALRHKSIDWCGAIERRTMFLKFSPVHSAYSSYRYGAIDHPLVRVPAVW